MQAAEESLGDEGFGEVIGSRTEVSNGRAPGGQWMWGHRKEDPRGSVVRK